MDRDRRLRELEEALERCRHDGRLIERRLDAVLSSRTWRLSAALGRLRKGWGEWLRLPLEAFRALTAPSEDRPEPRAAAAQPGWPPERPLLSVAVLPSENASATVEDLLGSSAGDLEVFASESTGDVRLRPLNSADPASVWQVLEAAAGKYLACLPAGARVDRTWAEHAVLALENRLDVEAAAAGATIVRRRSARSRPARIARLPPGLVRPAIPGPEPAETVGGGPTPPWPPIDWSRRRVAPFSTDQPSVLIATAWLGGGGAERIALDLLDLGEEFSFALAATAPGSREWADRFRAKTPWVYGLSEIHPDAAEALVGLVDLHRPQGLILSSTVEGYRALAALRRRFPSLWIADILHNDAPEGRLADAVRSTDLIDQHFAVNERIADALAQSGVARSTIAVVRNGVDVERLTPELRLERRPEARARLGCADRDFTLAFVGRLSEEKDPELFLRTCALLLEERPTTPLRALVAGDGPERFRVENLLERWGLEERVHLLGWQDDAVDVFAAADLFVLTSKVEGTPLTLLEAMSLGCPVVAARVGGVAEVLADGESGWLPERREPAAFARCVSEAMGQPAEAAARAEAARRRVVEAHLGSSMLAAYRQALRAGLAAGRPV